MMLCLLHLSDIHITSSRDLVLQRGQAIARTLNELPHAVEQCIITLTGDVAWSGKEEQYELAAVFVGSIHEGLKEVRGIQSTAVIAVPGNHDCDFDREDDARPMLLRQIISQPDKTYSASVVNPCVAIQDSFFEFLSRIESLPRLDGRSRLAYRRDIRLGSHLIRFHCYNTAWVSQKNERQGELSFPPSSNDSDPSQPALSVSLFHHPLAWIQADNRRNFQTHVEATSDIILTGHEHQVGQFQKRAITGEINEYFEGTALQEHSNRSDSAFNIIIVDLVKQRYQFIQYRWSEGRYARVESTPDWRPFTLGIRRQSGFSPTAEFARYLVDPGAQFTHPARDRLTLDDIAVFPELKELQWSSDQRQRSEVVYGKDLSSKLQEFGKVVVYGAAHSGKTTLAKLWTRELSNRDLVVLLLKASVIDSVDGDNLTSVLRAEFGRQYGDHRYPAFMQLNAARRAVILDDFHRSPWARKRTELITSLEVIFGTIIIIGDDFMRFQEVSYSEPGSRGNPFLEFRRFDIMPFGPPRRAKLIERWFSLSSASGADKSILSKKFRDTTLAVDQAIGHELVPSYPIFLLIIIQSYEAFSPVETPVSSSRSYGYLFESMLAKAFESERCPTDRSTVYTYLAELAYGLFISNRRIFCEDDLRAHHERYCKEYRLSPDYDRLITFFNSCRVLQEDDGEYSFKYNYIYHYFVAHALSTDERRFAQHFERLTNTVHREQSASIIMFLVHLRKGERILEEMVKKARSLYAELPPCDMDRDVAALRAGGSLILRLPSGTTDRNREALLRHEDEVALSRPQEIAENEPESLDREVEDLLRLNVALKTIEILGQIIKSFPGATRGEVKKEIVEECYNLALRAMNAFLRIIINNEEALMQDIREWLRTRGVTPSAVGGAALNVIQWMGEMLALTLLIKTAEAVGISQLRQTYDEVVADKSRIGFLMMDLAVRLDYQTFPERKVEDLLKQVHKITFSRNVLARLVYRHFFLHEVKYTLKQRVCAKLDIRMKMATRKELRDRQLKRLK